MREIKFRAWSGEKMIFFGLCEGSSDLLLMDIMQFTGLKDKNGKEIYESDIIKSISAESGCVVSWDEKGFWKFWNISTGLLKMDEWEVIGNIYENPELLTALS